MNIENDICLNKLNIHDITSCKEAIKKAAPKRKRKPRYVITRDINSEKFLQIYDRVLKASFIYEGKNYANVKTIATAFQCTIQNIYHHLHVKSLNSADIPLLVGKGKLYHITKQFIFSLYCRADNKNS